MKQAISNEDMLARIEKIEERNKRVEVDKKWEGSWTRKLVIMFLTYIVVVTYLFVIGNDSPWINAIVPPFGFLLSTLAVGRLRVWWQSRLLR
ncbi:MAG TPA: hypothetical protein VLF62_03630 [Candidatus Saccharimonadales bacterium]|nr:hypothetical protein [Candidatus Saccharimonadales bacterium]